VGGVNMDALSMAGPSRDVTIVGPGKSELETYVKRLVEAQGRVLKPEANPERGSFFRSDHFSFAREGVPMAYFEAGEDLVNGGEAAGKKLVEDYIANRYHGPKDEYDPSWDWTGVVQSVVLYYQLGRELAESEAWPNWYPNAEFRAARDKARAGR
jgi:Zn-dependent M28 family amino/carboxypeptidase